MLMMVEMMSVTRARKDCMSMVGMGDGSARTMVSGKIVESTSGTVAATAVTVTTPAQK